MGICYGLQCKGAFKQSYAESIGGGGYLGRSDVMWRTRSFYLYAITELLCFRYRFRFRSQCCRENRRATETNRCLHSKAIISCCVSSEEHASISRAGISIVWITYTKGNSNRMMLVAEEVVCGERSLRYWWSGWRGGSGGWWRWRWSWRGGRQRSWWWILWFWCTYDSCLLIYIFTLL